MYLQRHFRDSTAEYEFAFPWERPPRGREVCSNDFSTARHVLAGDINDTSKVHLYRSILASMAELGPLQVSRLSDQQVIDNLAQMLVSGRVRLFSRSLAFFSFQERKPTAVATSAAPAPTPSWVEVSVVWDDTDQPIANLQLVVITPDGQRTIKQTGSDGRIRLDQITEGICEVRCSTVGVKLEECVNFVGEGETRAASQGSTAQSGAAARHADPLAIALIEAHKVKIGETLATIAAQAGTTRQDLAYFNWGTKVEEEIQSHLADDVGCTEKTPDGSSYLFDDRDNPGIVYVPKDSFYRAGTGSKHILRVTPVMNWRARRLEIEDAFFHTASAVFLPDVPVGAEDAECTAQQVAFSNDTLWEELRASHEEYANNLRTEPYEPPTDNERRLDGVALIAAVLHFLDHNEDYKLLIVGHTDRAGDEGYNQELSESRAVSTLAILAGDRDAFVETSERFHVAEDNLAFLRYAARTRGWPCDLDQDQNASPEEIRRFQRSYNRAFDADIAVDGVVGSQTLGAFYDILEDDVKLAVGGEEQLESLRQKLRFVDDTHKWIGFGEQYPIEKPERNGYRSQKNRRVELLFFKPPQVPDLAEVEQAGVDIYRDKRYRFTPLSPAEITRGGHAEPSGQFELVDAERPQPGIGEPEEELATTMEVVSEARDDTDAWAFLEPLDAATAESDDSSSGASPDGSALA